MMLLLFGALFAVPTVPVAADTKTVALKNTKFSPDGITVAPGDTVVWKNEDQAGHTVTFDDGSFDSHPNCVQPLIGNAVNCMNQGETVQRSFEAQGEYKYSCKLHASNGRGMVGLVSVKPAVVVATTVTTTATTQPPTTVTAAATTTTTRKLATSSTLPSTTTSTAPAESTTTIAPNEAPAFDPGDDGDGDGETGASTPASSGGGGGGSGTVALIVGVLLAVAGGGGLLLWRLRPRPSQ